MTTKTIKADSFEPDYGSNCDLCDASPVVTVVKDGEVLHSTNMCGPCTWGEANMIDPDNWN